MAYEFPLPTLEEQRKNRVLLQAIDDLGEVCVALTTRPGTKVQPYRERFSGSGSQSVSERPGVL
jgi:hypothetical protein